MNQPTFIVGARHDDGKTSRFHVEAANHESARIEVGLALSESGIKPTAILTCIPGGKQ